MVDHRAQFKPESEWQRKPTRISPDLNLPTPLDLADGSHRGL
jgi:hypothetical protein